MVVVIQVRLAYYRYVEHVQEAARRVSGSVAGVLQELELRQPKVVTGALLAAVLVVAGSDLSVQVVAERLVRGGWLLPLRSRDSWEFIPASRAGRYSAGDQWIELRALLARKPDVPISVAFASAVWALGLSSHQPARATFAHSLGWRPPQALDDAQAVSYEWRLSAEVKSGLPVWQPATTLVAAAARPHCQDDWGNADEWLPSLARAAKPADIVTEAVGRGSATLARLGYLAEWSGCDDIVEAVAALLPRRLSVTYLGPREPRGRWVNRWQLYDSLLASR